MATTAKEELELYGGGVCSLGTFIQLKAHKHKSFSEIRLNIICSFQTNPIFLDSAMFTVIFRKLEQFLSPICVIALRENTRTDSDST